MLQLFEDDGVPGAKLNPALLHQYVAVQLKRWLECRGLPKTGRKAILISRIKNHIINGQAHILDPKVDGGAWLDAKRKGSLAAATNQDVQPSGASRKYPLPVMGWRHFPGYTIPANFNEGHVYHYLVETVPDIVIDGRRVTVEDDDGSDCEDFEAALPGSEKLFRKAKRIIHSDYVQDVQDCQFKGRYYVRCHVRASMESRRYKVDLAVSETSGAVLYAECHKCPASAMDRCCHISAVLFFIVKHINEQGHNGMLRGGVPLECI